MSDDSLAKLVDSLIEERKSERKFKFLSRIFFVVLLLIIFYLSLSSPMDNNIYQSEHTAVIKLDGLIASNGTINTESTLKLIRKAFDNDLCKNIILKINSPGGSATQSKIIYDEILNLKKNTNKQIFSVIEDVGASGGYYIAASADKIFASNSSIVGSIGVRIDSLNFKSLFNKLGIKSQTISSGKNKLILDPFQDLSEEHKTHLTQLANSIHNEFISDIKISRGDLIKDDVVFSGLFWTGNEALSIGLIDQISSIYDVNRDYFNNSKLITYNKKPSLLDNFINSIVTNHLRNNIGLYY